MSDGSQLLLKHVDFEDNTEAVRGMLERYCSSIQEYVKNGVTAEADEDTLVVDFLRSLTPIPRSTALEKAVETGWPRLIQKIVLGNIMLLIKSSDPNGGAEKGMIIWISTFLAAACCGAFSHTIHAI